jgi:hypothetical protein
MICFLFIFHDSGQYSVFNGTDAAWAGPRVCRAAGAGPVFIFPQQNRFARVRCNGVAGWRAEKILRNRVFAYMVESQHLDMVR